MRGEHTKNLYVRCIYMFREGRKKPTFWLNHEHKPAEHLASY